jgi:dTMP kinase
VTARGAARGRFLVLEGPDGCGKTTQIRLLGDRLAKAGVPHVTVREPGGTAVGEAIRPLILRGVDMPPRSELLMYLAARAALVEERIRPALQDGALVIADRYFLSSLAYQGYGRGLPIVEEMQAVEFATGGLKPDLTILLELSDEDARARSSRRKPDRIERADPAFRGRVRRGYAELATADPGIEVVDASGGVRTVHRAILAVLGRTWPETFASGSV